MEVGVASPPTTPHHDEHHGPPDGQPSRRASRPSSSGCCFSSSPRSCSSERSSRPTSSSGSWRTPVVPARRQGAAEVVAGVNTAMLVSSSFTMHWALEGARNGNRRALQVGLLTTVAAGPDVPLGPDQRVRPHRLRAVTTTPRASIFYGLTGLHGAHVFVGLTLLTIATMRAFRGHFSPKEHRGVEVPGIYWHFVDVMWIFVYTHGLPPLTAC